LAIFFAVFCFFRPFFMLFCLKANIENGGFCGSNPAFSDVFGLILIFAYKRL
jgi:hypothetical protein